MKKYMLLAIFAIASLGLNAQDVKVGDVLEIGELEAQAYHHINFPKANFIIKGGDLVNYKQFENDKVVVTDVKEKSDGTTKIKIKRADGKRFFKKYTHVTVYYQEAVASGELRTL